MSEKCEICGREEELTAVTVEEFVNRKRKYQTVIKLCKNCVFDSYVVFGRKARGNNTVIFKDKHIVIKQRFRKLRKSRKERSRKERMSTFFGVMLLALKVAVIWIVAMILVKMFG